MENMSFVKKLQMVRLPKIDKINRIPGIEEFNNKGGLVYSIKYFMFDNTQKLPKIIRITSYDKSFVTINSIDIMDAKMERAIVFKIKPEITKDEFLRMLNDIVYTTKHKRSSVSESFMYGLNRNNLNEGFGDFQEAIFMAGLFGLIFAIELLYKYRYLFSGITNWYQEKYTKGPMERKQDLELFSGQDADEPAYGMYATVIKYIEHVISGRGNALILCGEPGMSKTYIARRTMFFAGLKPMTDYVILKGSTLGLSDTYELLYKYRNKIIVLDDFDTPLKNEEMVNMLKAITDSYSRRIVSFPREEKRSANMYTERHNAPDTFEFRGQLIIITNLTKDQISPALISRAPVIEVNFDTKKVIDSIERMMVFVKPEIPRSYKQEVFDYICQLYIDDPSIKVSFRSYTSSVETRIGNPDGWKEMVKIIVGYKGRSAILI